MGRVCPEDNECTVRWARRERTLEIIENFGTYSMYMSMRLSPDT